MLSKFAIRVGVSSGMDYGTRIKGVFGSYFLAFYFQLFSFLAI